MNTLMENGVQLTLEQWMPQIFQRQTAGVLEPHARISLSEVKEEDLTETEALSLEKYLGSLKRFGKKIDPNGSSMKTLRECLAVTEDLTSCPYSLKWIGGGTTSNGKYSSLVISGFLRNESESTLSDILEDEVPEKYFLSTEQMNKIVFDKSDI